MASVYVANVLGDGLTPSTAYRPSGFDGIACAVVMLDAKRGRCLVLSSIDTVTATGVSNLATAATVAALQTLAATTNPTTTKRTQINAWLTGAGLATLTVAQVSWLDCLQFVALQINPVANLIATSVGG